MGFPSLHENILERITEGLSSLLRDEEFGNRGRSNFEEQARLEAIKRVQNQIGRVLEEHLEIATTPGMELVEKIKDLQERNSALSQEVTNTKDQVIQEQALTREALQKVAQKDVEIITLKKENDRLQMKVAFLSVKDNGGRSNPTRSKRS
ncbi:MAG: hypothetical protein ACXWUD_05435 [Methylosarcina sp.]